MRDTNYFITIDPIINHEFSHEVSVKYKGWFFYSTKKKYLVGKFEQDNHLTLTQALQLAQQDLMQYKQYGEK